MDMMEPSSSPNLQLFLTPIPQPEPPWTVASPLHTAASVPFQWEKEPGKPKPCTTLINLPIQKCLVLPPRLLVDAEVTKLSSPTSVFEGPYMGRSKFQSFSSKSGSFSKNFSPQEGKSGSLSVSKRWLKWKGGKGNGDDCECECDVSGGGGGSSVFPSPDSESNITMKTRNMKRSTSFSSFKPHFLVAIYEGLKQANPWKK